MLIAKVRTSLRERGLLRAGRRLIVACSGGPDSMALVHVLSRLAESLELELLVATVDHGLRKEARRECALVNTFASSLGLACVELRVVVERGSSTQAHAREARYGALQRLREERGFDSVAVGHSMDDQAETVLARLLRGGGLQGLCAIRACREDGVIRPLLDCRREELRGYVRQHGITVAQDPTNLERAYQRVRIRHEILPRLIQEDPGLVSHLADLADDSEALLTFVDAHVAALLPSCLDAEGRLLISVVNERSRAERRYLLRRWILTQTGSGGTRSQLAALDRLLASKGEVRLAAGWVVDRAGDRLSLSHQPKRPTRSCRTGAS